VAGREVSVLESGWKAAGGHAASWNGCDAAGRPVGNGIYFLRLTASGATTARRIAVMR